MPVGFVDGVPFKIPITSTGGSGGATGGSGGTKEAVATTAAAGSDAGPAAVDLTKAAFAPTGVGGWSGDTGTSGISNSGVFGSAGGSGSAVPDLLTKVSTGGDHSVVFHSFSSEAANSTDVVDRDGFALNHSAGADVVNFASHGTDIKVEEVSWDSQFSSGLLDWGV
jgi:hypothetical protein